MFGLGLLLGSMIGNNGISVDHGISDEMRRQNDLKEREIIAKAELDKRKEWLDGLKRMSDNSLIALLNSTDKYISFAPAICGGAGNVILHELPQESKVNDKYIDIEKECNIRGII